MTSSTARLLFLRLTGILAQGFLLTAGTLLFAFGMLELFNLLAAVAVAIAWFTLPPAVARARAAAEYAEHGLGSRVDATGAPVVGKHAVGITEAEYTRLRALRTRSRIRMALSIPRDRFDLAQVIVTSTVWVAYLGFIGSVIAGG